MLETPFKLLLATENEEKLSGAFHENIYATNNTPTMFSKKTQILTFKGDSDATI